MNAESVFSVIMRDHDGKVEQQGAVYSCWLLDVE